MTVDRPSALDGRRRPPLFRIAWAIAALLCIAALLTVPSFAPWLSRVDYWTADWRTAFLSRNAAAPHPRVAIVSIDDDTLRDYASSPIDRGLLARIVRAIDEAGARAIGIDVFFLKKTEPEKDAALTAAIRAAKATVVLGAIDERGELQPFQREFQSSFLAGMSRPVGYLNLRHERDDVVRYTASSSPGSVMPKSFARLLAEAAGATAADDAGKPIAWLLKTAGGEPAFLKVPAQDLLGPAAGEAAKALKDRIVLLGGDFPLRDRHRVPLTVRDGEPMTGVTIHANILAGLLEPGRAVSELPPANARLLLGAVALAGFGLGWRLWRSTAVNFLGWSFASAVLVGIDAFCFAQMRLLLPFTLALVAWVAGIAAGRSLHMVAEYLTSREVAHMRHAHCGTRTALMLLAMVAPTVAVAQVTGKENVPGGVEARPSAPAQLERMAPRAPITAPARPAAPAPVMAAPPPAAVPAAAPTSPAPAPAAATEGKSAPIAPAPAGSGKAKKKKSSKSYNYQSAPADGAARASGSTSKSGPPGGDERRPGGVERAPGQPQ